MSVSSPAAVGAFELAETKPDNCRKPTVWRSVGAADRWLTGMCVIKGRERESAPGQSGCDRGGPPRCDRTHRTDGSQLDVHVWLSGLEAEPSGNPALLISFTGCVHKPPTLRGIAASLPFPCPPPPIHLTHLYASSQVTTQNG